MTALIGNWKYESTNNLDALMDKLGVADVVKKAVKDSKPTLEISKNGDKWNFKAIVGDKTRDMKFKLGEEFQTVALTGEMVKSTITLEGDVMTEKFDWKEYKMKLSRQVIDGKLVSEQNNLSSNSEIAEKYNPTRTPSGLKGKKT